ncbi:MAG: phosphate acyltransferase PlsX [Gemmatimonadota bacterium]
MRIAVDAMGGDRAPEVPVAGALSALRELTGDFEIVLVGQRERVQPYLVERRIPEGRLRIHHASQVVDMNEAPSSALRRKKDSSILAGLDLQRSGEADAFISAGNTGAVMAASLHSLGRIEGIGRPAIVTVFPTAGAPCLLLDVGANAECRPEHLLQFALMGRIYAMDVLGRPRPRIGLLSIGEGPTKGDDLTVAAHRLLEDSDLDFVGNLEGRDVLRGAADVVVTDGFTGNVVLKFGESFVDFLATALREEIRRHRLAAMGALLMRPVFRAVRRRIDYAEYGGAPLLGVNGIVIIGHGRSSVKAYRNAVRVALLAVERRLNVHIEEAVREVDGQRRGTVGSRTVAHSTATKEGE